MIRNGLVIGICSARARNQGEELIAQRKISFESLGTR